MRRLLAAGLVLPLLLAACGDDGGDPEPTAAGDGTRQATRESRPGDREEQLRDDVASALTAVFASGSADAYGYASAGFKEKCPLEDFAGAVGLVRLLLGELDEDRVEVEVTDVRFEDDRAYVTMRVLIDGEEFGEADEGVGDYWVYEDGGWKFATDDDEPCGNFSSSGDDDDDATPASGPGSSRSEPAPPGSAVTVGDMRITVVSADLNADLAAVSEFDPTPVAGRRAVLVRVRVEHAGEASSDETVDVSESMFSLTGSGNVVYDGFSEDESCGFLADGIDAELFAGGSAEGDVCFQVPEDETGLLLIVEPAFSFDDGGRRFLALE
ncbi:MAG TPA: DUF4352 domain-containing protein [Dehalococcoidia bacterium]|nr:DUF4352 domain-containing protein [Dehalococcoidia bacterium]